MKAVAIFLLWTCGTNRGTVQGLSSSAPRRGKIPTSNDNADRRRHLSSSYLLYASSNDDTTSSSMPFPAQNLSKMVDEISNDQSSPEAVAKMAELEQALAAFLQENSKGKYQKRWSPRPPGTPPPLKIFLGLDGATQKVSMVEAEAALEKLRGRLRKEEEALRLAEEALQQTTHEEEVLRRAEEALQRSREAAEKRKMEALRQTKVAAASIEEAKRAQEEAEQAWGQQQFQGNGDHHFSNDSFSRGMEAPRSTIPLEFLVQPTSAPFFVPDVATPAQNDKAIAPPDIPILYNWVQYIDGSIHAKVRNSESFPDGASISTSAVSQGAKAGSIIETSSGSQYYLEIPTIGKSENSHMEAQPAHSVSQRAGSTVPPHLAAAPEGVPSILSWELLEDGAVAGLLYGSPNAGDGDYIETSPIAHGTLESGQMVTTQSGSQYFLSHHEAEKAANTIAACRDMADAERGSTITITKALTSAKNNGMSVEQNMSEEAVATPSIDPPKSAKPRPTFSLFNLFNMGSPKQQKRPGRKFGPRGVPLLTGWTTNVDGSITGVVSGSPTMNDGDMVTTSPIVSGATRQFESVTTASGSTYYLG